MARMHTRKKGRSKSHKPLTQGHAWVKMSHKEITDIVLRLAKEGKTEALIGQTLRDQYAVPSVKAMTGKSVTQLLAENKAAKEYPTDLIELIRKAVRLRKHIGQNNRDIHNKVRLTRIESKIKRLVRYYRGKKLPKNWTYEPEKAALLVK
ncbi:30S ribosomal protein S15 [Candidatus Norongarragalina meridionalis]|nr:30S ribosomal protein S15 [Candidatus Norongarragalina meridionalis]